MIKTILFILFVILTLVSVGLVSITIRRKSKLDNDFDKMTRPEDRWGNKAAMNPDHLKELQEEYETKTKFNNLLRNVFLVFSLVSIACLVLIPGSFHQVNTGTVAVVRKLGKIEGIRQPGTYFDLYLTKSYEIYDTKVQQVEIRTAAYSKDGQTMELEVFLQYQVQSENIMKVATEYGGLDALQSRIETQTIEKTKAVMSSDIAMNIIQKHILIIERMDLAQLLKLKNPL